jgi:anaerobic selenocysteine-containing dehydrogenase
MINSIFGEFADQAADVQMHPADADRYGLADGAVAELVSADGAVVTAAVRVTTTVREGVLVMPKGVWLRHHRDGLGVNALTPAWGDPVTDGACFNDARVQVRPQPSSVAAPAN